MNRCRLFFFLISFFLIPLALSAQREIVYENFTSESGLSENVVYCLLKDRRGFIWAGTDHGLNRYDGYRFKHYYGEMSDSTSLSNTSILCMKEDREGLFWIGTYEGLNHFNPMTGKSKRVLKPGRDLLYTVEKIEQLKDGSLLLMENSQLCARYFPETGQYRDIPLPRNWNIVNSHFIETPGGGIAVVCRNERFETALWVFNADYSSWVPAGSNLFPFSQPANPEYLFPMGDSAVWISGDPPNFIAAVSSKLRPFSQHNNSFDFNGLLVYGAEKVDEEIWLATNKGIILLNLLTGLVSLPPLKGDSKSMEGSKEIRCVLNDQQGSVWLGTFGEGLLRHDYRKLPFQHLSLSELTGGRFQRMIFGLYPWRGDTIAAETGFQNYILVAKGRIAGYVPREQLNTASRIYQFTTGREFISLPPLQQRLFANLHARSALAPFRFVLQGDSAVITFVQQVIVATARGIRHIPLSRPGNLTADRYYYWIASNSGLLRIRKSDLQDSLFTSSPGLPYSPDHVGLYHSAADGKGGLWIGCKGGGVYHFNKATATFTRYTTHNGLPDNVVYSLLADPKGNLWLTTNKGISMLNPATRTFTNYSRRHGLVNSEFNRQGAVLTPAGWIYLAGTSGIDFFRPEEIEPEKNLLKVSFSEIRIHDREAIPGEMLNIPFTENNLFISFTAGNFIRPDLVYYRYRLGEKQDWIRVQGQNSLQFNALRPGKYRFEVQAGYDNLNWSESATLTFRIKTPWWRSFVFFAGLGLLFIVGVYFLYRYRLAQIKRMYRLRASISQDLHDEVGSSLSSIHIYSSVAEKAMEKEPMKAREALRQIQSGSQRIMENMGDIVWAINLGQSGNSTLEVKVKNFGYELLTPSGIECRYEIDPEAEALLQRIRIRRNLLLVAKEALNNIAKYSQASEVLFRLRLSGTSLQLFIADNGKGFDPAVVSAGNGLHNMRERMMELGGDFRCESGPGAGTRVICTLPVTRIREY